MRHIVTLAAVLAILLGTGCASTEGHALSYNMTQSVSRSAGDIAMTALLDEGVDEVKARKYAEALAELVQGDLSKAILREEAFRLADKFGLTGAADYIDALLSIVPSEISAVEKIPEKYHHALSSFLRDGAIRAMDIYDFSRAPRGDEV